MGALSVTAPKRREGVDFALPAGGVIVAVAALLVLFAGRSAVLITEALSNFLLVSLLAYTIRHISNIPGLPHATRRFWRTEGLGIAFYALGMLVDLGFIVSRELFGTVDWALGTQFLFPIAGLLILVAMFQYPTIATTRGERATVALDASIVLLGSSAFIWYFSVSTVWVPADGLAALFVALFLPVMALVTGFAVLKIAFNGAGVIARVPLAWFAIAASGSALASAFATERGSLLDSVGFVMTALCQIASLAGAVTQYRINRRDGNRLRMHRRRAFSVLPYGASIAAFLLLVVVIAGTLNYRQWGVLGGVGFLLCAVTVRQIVALRENARLLSSNEALTERLRRQAWYDELTGLANRALLAERVDTALHASRRDGSCTAVFLIDLDDFKSVNDTLGHSAGDELLCEVARRLTAEVRPTDTVCRLGGDEFVIIAQGIDRAGASAVAGRLVRALSEPVLLAAGTAEVGASVGIAFGVRGTLDAGALLREADVAMYAAKEAGKGSWRAFDGLRPVIAPPESAKSPATVCEL